MNEQNQNRQDNQMQSAWQTAKKQGGLYRNVKMSVKAANTLVAVTAVTLLLAMLFMVRHNGFTVTFDTDGGSHIENVKLMHSETVPVAEDPVKEGCFFTGWYVDRSCTVKWDIEKDTVTESMTLYAGWEKSD